jgi:hypothetical protein
VLFLQTHLLAAMRFDGRFAVRSRWKFFKNISTTGPKKKNRWGKN